MKALNILASNVTMKQLQREVLINTKGQCNCEATATGDLTKHEKQYMKESNTIVGNAANNFLRRKILRNIKG